MESSSKTTTTTVVVVVGSAELSPIELKGIVPEVSNLATTNRTQWLYVTDVVTSANHRRLGVGTKLMDAIETAATLQSNATRIYLHVCPENIGAMKFYFKRGFQKTTMCSEEIDADKLAAVAGARGQILLQKELITGDNADEQIQKRNSMNKQRTWGGYKGFAKMQTKT